MVWSRTGTDTCVDSQAIETFGNLTLELYLKMCSQDRPYETSSFTLSLTNMALPILSLRNVHLAWMMFSTILSIIGESFASQEAPVVNLTTGQVIGRRVTLNNEYLNKVDRYLGIPYARPPVGDLRFRGTSYPAESWVGEKNATVYGPVCPQVIPEVKAAMPRWLQKPIEDSRPFLKESMSEDCLYLNVYVPMRGSDNSSLAVAVFIHGDSFESGAGSLYDGGVLSSYGDVIVVTFNYRLGILGFLSSDSRSLPGNYGLQDQVAALQWVHDNIGAFGGDPKRVTLIGAGTGGACAGLLMLSNRTRGLFSRVIAESGAPLSPWAISRNPVGFYDMVREYTGCDTGDTESAMVCLRNLPYEDFLKLGIPTPLYSVSFGPVVDGDLIEDDPVVMLQEVQTGQRSLTPSAYMTGLTKNEAFPYISESIDSLGRITKDIFEQTLDGFVQNNFGFSLLASGVIRDTISHEYTDWTAGQDNPYTMTTSIQDIITDHQWVTPAVQTLKGLDVTDVTSYFYLFTHKPRQSINPRYDKAGSVHLEELPFVFGAPVVSGPLRVFRSNFTKVDALVSLSLMTYWSNFIKTGDPNRPTSHAATDLHNHFGHEFENSDTEQWPIFNNTYQQVMYLSSNSRIKDYYRVHQISLWEDLIPRLESRLISDVKIPKDPLGPETSDETTSPATNPRGDSVYNSTSEPITCAMLVTASNEGGTHQQQEGYKIELSMVIAVGGFFLFCNLIVLGIIYYLRDRKKVESRLAAKYLAYLETIKKKRTNGRGFMQSTPDSGISSATLLNPQNNGRNKNTYGSSAHPATKRDGTIRINEDGDIEFEV